MQTLDKGQNRTICKYEKGRSKSLGCKTQNLGRISPSSLAEFLYQISQFLSTYSEDFNQ